MLQHLSVGQICLLIIPEGRFSTGEPDLRAYRAAKSENVDRIIIVRELSSETYLCAKLYKSNPPKSIAVSSEGFTYHASSGQFIKISSAWLAPSSTINPTVAQQLQQAHSIRIRKNTQRNKVRKKRKYENCIHQTDGISAIQNSPVAKSVSWSAAHPFQGGSMTPK